MKTPQGIAIPVLIFEFLTEGFFSLSLSSQESSFLCFIAIPNKPPQKQREKMLGSYSFVHTIV